MFFVWDVDLDRGKALNWICSKRSWKLAQPKVLASLWIVQEMHTRSLQYLSFYSEDLEAIISSYNDSKVD